MNELYRLKIETCFKKVNDSYNLIKNKKWNYFSKKSLVDTAGYKIHVSCSVDILSRDIEKYLEFLFRLEINFKIPASLDIARKITNGDFGLSQVGKSITIYLDGQTEIIDDIAKFFSEANGPLIPFEIPINEKKTVFIRFGAYKLDCDYDIFGRPIAIYYLDDKKILDNRETKLNITELPNKVMSFDSSWDINSELDNKYLALQLISNNAKSKIYKGYRVYDFLKVIIKVVPNRFATDIHGISSDMKILNEFRSLEFLSQNSSLNKPQPLLFKKLTDFSILIVQEIENCESFDKLHKSTQLELFKKIIKQVDILHSSNTIHGDIKMKNILFSNDKIYLIDFETCQNLNNRYENNYGTIGYYLEESDYKNQFYEIDYQCLISLLIGIYLGHDPSLLPFNKEQRVVLLKLNGYEAQAALVEELISNPSLIMTDDIQNRIQINGLLKDDTFWKKAKLKKLDFTGTLRSINREFDTQKHNWNSNHLYSDYSLAALNIGGAGTLLGLLTICSNTKKYLPNYTKLAVDYLSKFDYGENSNGLFTGKSGLALSLLLYARISNDKVLLNISYNLLKQTCSLVEEPDMFGGIAGILYAHVLAYSIYADQRLNDNPKKLYSYLIATAKESDGMIYWEPSGLLENNKYPFWGVAHGSVGILFSIYKYAVLNFDEPGIKFSINGLKSSFRNIKPETKSVFRYITNKSKRDSNIFFWCHGLIGYLWVLGQLEHVHQSFFKNEISQCLQLLEISDIPLNSTMCHGLAGILETYMCFLSNPDFYNQFSSKAEKIAKILESTANNSIDQLWYSESPEIYTPDLMVGYTGSAAVLSQYYCNNFKPVLSTENFQNIINERKSLFKQ